MLIVPLQASAKEKEPAAKKLNSTDKSFMDKAASDSAAEVALGKIALEKATDSKVKNYADMIVKQHQEAGDQLTSIASEVGYTPKVKETRDQKKNQDKLTKLSGTDFDREFMKIVVKDHKDALGEYNKEVKKGENPQVKSWATKMVGALQHHLRTAETIQSGIKSAQR